MGRSQSSGVPSFLHYDFCPWANQYVYWLKRPIGWVILAGLASLLLGIYVSPKAFLAAGIVLAIGIIGAIWPWISLSGVQGTLSWSPNRCEEGDTLEAELTITNRLPWPALGLMLHTDTAIACPAGAPGQPVSLSRIPGWTRSSYRWDCRPTVRGVYPTQSIRLSSAFPFGIWSSAKEMQVPEALVVWPRTIRLTDVPDNPSHHRLGMGGCSPTSGDEGEWTGVRPYREGDSLRQVHWAQSARRDQLVVFERQARSRQTVSITLNSKDAAQCEAEEREWMVRIFASVALQFLSHHWNVRVSMNDCWSILHGGHRSAWLDQLAAWQPDGTQDDSRGNDLVRDHSPLQISRAADGLHIVINALPLPWLLEIDADPCHPEVDAMVREVWRQACQSTVASKVGVAS
jgi:uncharacterized protein (DUF58 family)